MMIGDPVRVRTHTWQYSLPAEFGHEDITRDVQELVSDSGVVTGVVTVGTVGSTGAVTTIEYEPGALEDLRQALERAAPVNGEYQHNLRWGDGNGFSHVRSALLKTGLSIPVTERRLMLGTWQQLVVLNLDNRARRRDVVAVVMGS